MYRDIWTTKDEIEFLHYLIRGRNLKALQGYVAALRCDWGQIDAELVLAVAQRGLEA